MGDDDVMALRAERDELRAALAEALSLMADHDVWNCMGCGADLERGDPCDATCRVRAMRELAGVQHGGVEGELK